MKCPTCDLEMTTIGCCLVEHQPVRWCAGCGTLAPCDAGNATAPALVYGLRSLIRDVAEPDSLPKKNRALAEANVRMKAEINALKKQLDPERL